MCFVKTDMRKYELLKRTNILSNKEDNGVYDIQLFLDNNFIIQYNGKSYQGIIERYKQHIGNGGKIRKCIDLLENDLNIKVNKIELKTLKNYKKSHLESVRKTMKETESKIINKRQAQVLALKRKKVIFLNEDMDVFEVITQLFKILQTN